MGNVPQYGYNKVESRQSKCFSASLLISHPLFLFAFILLTFCSTISRSNSFVAATPQSAKTGQPLIFSELSSDYVVLKLTDAGALPINETLVVDFHPSYEVFGRRERSEDSDNSPSSASSASFSPSSRNRHVEAGTEQLNLTSSSPDVPSDETSPENPSYHRGVAYISPRPLAVSSARILYGAADVVCYMLESPDFNTVETLPIRAGQPLELGDWPFKGVGMVTCLMPR